MTIVREKQITSIFKWIILFYKYSVEISVKNGRTNFLCKHSSG